MARLNGYLGRLAGLLLLWLTNDEHATQSGFAKIFAVLSEIDKTQDEVG